MFKKMTDINALSKSYSSVLERISEATLKRTKPFKGSPILVAASKTKPAEAIIELYHLGQRHFGENYLQELIEKSNNPKLRQNCPDIQWHYIGHLQTNKIKKILDVPNLHLLETVDSAKMASALQKECLSRGSTQPLKVMVQVNTSDEENKSGCPPSETTSLVDLIRHQCPLLLFSGLMTIGLFDHDLSTGPNPDFILLSELRERVCAELGMGEDAVPISMGMSNDFQHAIEQGSDIVRVGTAIFGARVYPDKK